MLRRARVHALPGPTLPMGRVVMAPYTMAFVTPSHRRKASTSVLPRPQRESPQPAPMASYTTEEEHTDPKRRLKDAAKAFEAAGINPRLSMQLVTAFPFIQSPTAAQKALLSAVTKDNDIILRAHTGTGKSFGLLLGLLNKPRLVVKESEEESKRDKRITSIIVVPSRELAKQYEGWAKQLFPQDLHHTLPSVVAVHYRTKDVSVDDQLSSIAKNPPHVLIITPTVLYEMLSKAKGLVMLGIPTLRTLVYDEGDALLELPGRFPSQKLVWNHLRHPSDALRAINAIMKSRATFSGGVALPSAGFETERNAVKEDIRRKVHQGNDLLEARRNKVSKVSKKEQFTLSEARQPYKNERPLQLIFVSATANSVLRSFLGARTGWLRTGVRGETKKELGKWLDLTGLSPGVNKGKEMEGLETRSVTGWALQLPKELRHSCVVVDEPTGEGDGISWRELNPSLARQGRSDADADADADEGGQRLGWGEIRKKAPRTAERTGPLIVAPTTSSQSALDEHLLTCLAYLYASQPVHRSLALIPATWSLAKARTYLEDLDVPVRYLDEEGGTEAAGEEAGEVLFLIQANAVRGIDVPGGLSHVFCLGVDSVRDATGYTHLAGRAARIGHDAQGSHNRPTGHVITLVRGVSTFEARRNYKKGKLAVIASSELKMSLIYKRLDVRVEKLNLLQQQKEEQALEDAPTGYEAEVDRTAEEAGSQALAAEEEDEASSADFPSTQNEHIIAPATKP